MGDTPPAAVRKPCCVCDAPEGKQCTKCKSRHYCSKKCQLVDWNEGGHKAQCKQLAIKFQDRLLDELMPPKKVKEETAIVEDVAPVAGLKAAARLSAVGGTAVVKASAPNDDAPDWRGTCAICLDVLPVEAHLQRFYDCCCKRLCMECCLKCKQYDDRCPLCRGPGPKSHAERVRRLQTHSDKGIAEAQLMLGSAYCNGEMGLKQSCKRGFQLYELAAAQGHAIAQFALGDCYDRGEGVKINSKTAAQWHRRAADQGYHNAQENLGLKFFKGEGVVQSYEEAVRWIGLAAAQGNTNALYNLGACYENGHGVPQDYAEALRCFKRAAARGHAGAAAAVAEAEARLPANRPR